MKTTRNQQLQAAFQTVRELTPTMYKGDDLRVIRTQRGAIKIAYYSCNGIFVKFVPIKTKYIK